LSDKIGRLRCHHALNDWNAVLKQINDVEESGTVCGLSVQDKNQISSCAS